MIVLFFFNHILLIKAQNNITGMEPVIAYEGLQFAIKTKLIAVHTFINSGLIGLGMSVTILVGVIYYKKKEILLNRYGNGDYERQEEIECM